MEQFERLEYLIRHLLKEEPKYGQIVMPGTEAERQRLLRSLVNLRPPWPVDEEFLRIQDEYLVEELDRKGMTELEELSFDDRGICRWRGDITTLRVDAIVNAANSQLLGCFVPCHGCIDNAIHTSAGVQLRLACAEIAVGTVLDYIRETSSEMKVVFNVFKEIDDHIYEGILGADSVR